MCAQVNPNRVGPFPFPKADPEKRKQDFSEVELALYYRAGDRRSEEVSALRDAGVH